MPSRNAKLEQTLGHALPVEVRILHLKRLVYRTDAYRKVSYLPATECPMWIGTCSTMLIPKPSSAASRLG